MTSKEEKQIGNIVDFFHFMLLHTEEGQEASKKVLQDYIDMEGIMMIKLGYCPKEISLIEKGLKNMEVCDDLIEQAKRFVGKVLIPMRTEKGNTIGFSVYA